MGIDATAHIFYGIPLITDKNSEHYDEDILSKLREEYYMLPALKKVSVFNESYDWGNSYLYIVSSEIVAYLGEPKILPLEKINMSVYNYYVHDEWSTILQNFCFQFGLIYEQPQWRLFAKMS